MKVNHRSDIAGIKKGEQVVVFTDEKAKNGSAGKREFRGAELLDGAELGSFGASAADVHYFSVTGRPAVILCGLGDISRLNADGLRNCAAAATRFCMGKKISGVSVIIPEVPGMPEESVLRNVAEGMLLANYTFNKYRSDKTKDAPLARFDFYTKEKTAAAVLKEVEIISANTFLCRDLVNDITTEVNPVTFADYAVKLAAASGIGCRVLTKKDIEKKGMGLLLAVNRGSSIEPRVVVLEYSGNPGSKKSFGLVGKGITFDSGGMDLKPAASMETMRSDMAGAATVLCTMKAIAEMKIRKNVAAVIPLTENMLSSSAFRPGDIYKSYTGNTVEIGNTDAEGRLILADAIAYMEKEIKPEVIVDMATLTGACVVTFGETVAAYLSTDDELARALEVASGKTGEKLWRLPFFDDYEDRMKSDVADLNNMAVEKNAGTISGAVFLKNFVEKTPWVHIDIAGTAWYTKVRGYRPKNATGYGLRLVLELVKGWK